MRRIWKTMCLVAAALVASACSKPAEVSPPGPPLPAAVDTVVVTDTVRVETEAPVNVQLEAQVSRLQLQLLEREAQVEGLQEQLEAARQEVVRNMAKLQSQASRAEAASGMAEAEIALEALGRVPGGSELSEFTQAQGLIAESNGEFNLENYGGALYLATQARALARGGQSRMGGGSGQSLREGESLFALPVPMLTVGRSNVRGGPGLSFDVLFTLDGGATLVGQSYTSQWVRVIDDAGREGWVFHTLVRGR